MNVPVMLLNSTGGNPFEQVSKPVVELLNMALTPALGIVGALGAIYCIFLGAKLAKAEEPPGQGKGQEQPEKRNYRVCADICTHCGIEDWYGCYV